MFLHELLGMHNHNHRDAPLFRRDEIYSLALAAAHASGHRDHFPAMQLLTCQVLRLKHSLSRLQAVLCILLRQPQALQRHLCTDTLSSGVSVNARVDSGESSRFVCARSFRAKVMMCSSAWC